jgi:NAD kinase
VWVLANSKSIFTVKIFSHPLPASRGILRGHYGYLCEIDSNLYIKIINKSNRNYQCKTKGLLDLSMTGINRVFVPDTEDGPVWWLFDRDAEIHGK